MQKGLKIKEKTLHEKLCANFRPVVSTSGSKCSDNKGKFLYTEEETISTSERKRFNHTCADLKTKHSAGSGNVLRCQTVHRLKALSASTISSTNLQRHQAKQGVPLDKHIVDLVQNNCHTQMSPT